MKILVIEDDADIASNIGQYFEAKGHELDFAYSGALGLKLAIDRRFDLIILDLMLPGKDGITVCREFREQSKHDTPILMLTARDTIDDKVSGFEAGTDDYLVKPFSLRELEVRVTALTRRGQNQPKSPVMRIDNLELNRDTMQVFRDSLPIKLKPKAFRILEYLMINPERVISRQELIDHVWSDDPPDGDPLRVHIHSLRAKIDKPFDSELIHTIHGVGYRIGSEAR
ncbi:MAG: response regulator [Gammaproteobacteria bacterium]|jgi:DNA-binding response OmpR family regulator|nr:response regulator [Gammaproteobacteria bacterium]